MSYRFVPIRITDLHLDTKNARLTEEQKNSSAALLAIAISEGEGLINLAADIVEQQMLNPLELPGVVPMKGQGDQYVVLEGNRRVAALKILESPDQVRPAYDKRQQARLDELHAVFLEEPIEEVTCVVYDSAEELHRWVELRHTGENNGVGLSRWVPGQQDRYRARHGGAAPSPRTQVEEFILRAGTLSDKARTSDRRILTTLQRIINNKDARAALGITIAEDKEVRSEYPREEVAKGLSRIYEDLMAGVRDSRSLNSAEQIRDYIRRLGKTDRPDPKTKLAKAVPLAELAAGLPTPSPKPVPKRRNANQPRERKTVAPRKLSLGIGRKRIKRIFEELQRLDAEEFTNASAVLMRVFLELSCDAYQEAHKLGDWKDRDPLAKKMKSAAKDLCKKGALSQELSEMVAKNADSSLFLAAAVPTFHQYVHNSRTNPKKEHLIDGWDELEPFFVALWP